MQISLPKMGHIRFIFWYSVYMGMQTISSNNPMNVWYTIQVPHAMSPSLLQHPLHHCSAGRYLKKIQVMGQYHNTTSCADSVMVIVCNHLKHSLRFKVSNWRTSILLQLTIAVCLPKEQMATAQNHAALKPPHKMVRYQKSCLVFSYVHCH